MNLDSFIKEKILSKISNRSHIVLEISKVGFSDYIIEFFQENEKILWVPAGKNIDDAEKYKERLISLIEKWGLQAR